MDSGWVRAAPWIRGILGVLSLMVAVLAILVGSFTSVVSEEAEQWYDDNCGTWGPGSEEDCSDHFDIYMDFKIATNASWGCGIVSVLVGLILLITSRNKEEKTVYIQQPPQNND